MSWKVLFPVKLKRSTMIPKEVAVELLTLFKEDSKFGKTIFIEIFSIENHKKTMLRIGDETKEKSIFKAKEYIRQEANDNLLITIRQEVKERLHYCNIQKRLIREPSAIELKVTARNNNKWNAQFHWPDILIDAGSYKELSVLNEEMSNYAFFIEELKSLEKLGVKSVRGLGADITNNFMDTHMIFHETIDAFKKDVEITFNNEYKSSFDVSLLEFMSELTDYKCVKWEGGLLIYSEDFMEKDMTSFYKTLHEWIEYEEVKNNM